MQNQTKGLYPVKLGINESGHWYIDKINKIQYHINNETKDVLKKLLRETYVKQNTDLKKQLYALHYEEPPVDLETFLTDEQYLGKQTFYENNKKIFKEFMGRGWLEVILTGSIGWGKTTTAVAGLMRVVYNLLNLKNPQTSLGLSPSSPIYIIAMSVTKELAKATSFQQIKGVINDSTWFQKRLKNNTKSEILFEKNIRIIPASAFDTSILGMNVVGGLLDEINFLDTKSKSVSDELRASTIYNGLKTRIKSRFFKENSLFPGRIFVVSSKNMVNSFLETLLNDEDLEGVYVSDNALWDIKPELFESGEFWVVVDVTTFEGQIFEKEEDADKYITNLKSKYSKIINKESLDEDVKTKTILDLTQYFKIRVPLLFFKEFKKDLQRALKDLAGVSVLTLMPYISNKKIVFQNIVDSKPRISPEILPSGNIYILNESAFKNEKTGEIQYKDVPRFIHFDLSKSMKPTGIAMGCVYDYRYNEETEGYEPLVWIDFMLRITPADKGIDYEQIRKLVKDLENIGFQIKGVSADSFQSYDMLNHFKNKGYDVEEVSTVKSMTAYDTLKNLMEEKRINYYYYEPFIKEVLKLSINLQKMQVVLADEKKDTKDVADAVAGVVYKAIKDKNKYYDLTEDYQSIALLNDKYNNRIEEEDYHRNDILTDYDF